MFGASRGIATAEPGASSEPKPHWIFTTKAHFSWYALLTGAPVYRDQIRSVLLDLGCIYVSLASAEFYALDRYRGDVLWANQLSLDGYPIADMFVQVGGRLVAGMYKDNTKELVIIGMDPRNGKLIWRVSLPSAEGPTLVGSDAVLNADPSRETVIVSVLGDNQWRRVVLRASDGGKVADAWYPGYVWRPGTPQVAGLILGYEGDPSGSGWKKYRKVRAFHESTGQPAWSLPLIPEGASSPSVLEDSLLMANGTQLLRIDIRTGQPRWKVDLGGRIMPDADPPLVVGSKIAVVHTSTPDPEDTRWQLSLHRFEDGAQETHVNLAFNELKFENPTVLRGMGNLAIVGSSLKVNVADIQRARLVAVLDFEKLFSRFVYAEPSMWIGGSDDQGFVAVTTDGVLRYFSAEDFHDSAPVTGPVGTMPEEGSVAWKVLSYTVMNPLWSLLQPNRLAFRGLFYVFPPALLGLAWVWKPTWTLIRRLGLTRWAGWGAVVGGFLALPAAVYRGLLGGIAAGFGTYGVLGPIWGGVVGFVYFLMVGAGLAAIAASLLALAWRRRC